MLRVTSCDSDPRRCCRGGWHGGVLRDFLPVFYQFSFFDFQNFQPVVKLNSQSPSFSFFFPVFTLSIFLQHFQWWCFAFHNFQAASRVIWGFVHKFLLSAWWNGEVASGEDPVAWGAAQFSVSSHFLFSSQSFSFLLSFRWQLSWWGLVVAAQNFPIFDGGVYSDPVDPGLVGAVSIFQFTSSESEGGKGRRTALHITYQWT